MNASVYLFGKFNGGYTQYPDDYTSKIFEIFKENAKSTTQIAIHRESNLMYYGYIRKLEQGCYIGFCIVLNDLVLTRIDGLFSLFENTVSSLVTKGQLIHFNEQGSIVTKVERLYLQYEEVNQITESLRTGFSSLESHTRPLPAVSYGISKDSIKSFAYTESVEEIIRSSYSNGYTFVYKSKEYDTAQINSYRGVLTKTYKEKQELRQKLEELQKEHAKTLRQKKQFKFVLFLTILLMVCAISLLSLKGNLNLTRDALLNANDIISMQNDSLSTKSNQISNLCIENRDLEQSRRTEESQRISAENKLILTLDALSCANDTISRQNDLLNSQRTQISNLNVEKHDLEQNCQIEKSQRVAAENNLENFKSMIRNRMPFIIKSTSFDFGTGYLTFNYYGMTEGSITINVCAYSDKGERYSNSKSIYIKEGNGSASIYLSRSLNSGKWYSFELLNDKIILGGDRH